MKIAIVSSKFNEKISNNLLKGAINCYKNNYDDDLENSIYIVPGAFEIPSTVKQLLKNNHDLDGIVTLGCIIKGETAHFEYISSSVTASISNLSIEAKIPIIYGILTTYDFKQALKRSDPNKKNKGGEVMQAAIDTIKIYKDIQKKS